MAWRQRNLERPNVVEVESGLDPLAISSEYLRLSGLRCQKSREVLGDHCRDAKDAQVLIDECSAEVWWHHRGTTEICCDAQQDVSSLDTSSPGLGSFRSVDERGVIKEQDIAPDVL